MKATITRGSRGFTLIELMIVIAIMAILSALMVPNFVRARSVGQLVACKSNLKSIATAMEVYAIDHKGRYPNALSDLAIASQQYLVKIPVCPAVMADTYSSTYSMCPKPENYTFYCAGGHHVGAGVTGDYPQYGSASGLVERAPGT